MTLPVITEDHHLEYKNPTPDYDIAPSPKLYQSYLRAWYQAAGTVKNKENNPTPDFDFVTRTSSREGSHKIP
jgi:hypothetical protein